MMVHYDPLKHHRRSIRLKGYDYSRAGAYFVTAVNQGRLCVYGDVVNGQMVLNAAGQMIEKWWLELNHKFPTIETDVYVVMPNHFHGIVVIMDDGDESAGGEGGHTGPPQPGPPQPGPPQPGAPQPDAPQPGAPLRREVEDDDETAVGADLRVRPAGGQGAHAGPPLHTVMQWFKTMTTNEYIRGVKTLGWPPFARKLWQRDYYEHIIRAEDELDRSRQYIADNPLRWDQDDENPAVIASIEPH